MTRYLRRKDIVDEDFIIAIPLFVLDAIMIRMMMMISHATYCLCTFVHSLHWKLLLFSFVCLSIYIFALYIALVVLLMCEKGLGAERMVTWEYMGMEKKGESSNSSERGKREKNSNVCHRQLTVECEG